jgi:hypothetical protein
MAKVSLLRYDTAQNDTILHSVCPNLTSKFHSITLKALSNKMTIRIKLIGLKFKSLLDIVPCSHIEVKQCFRGA